MAGFEVFRRGRIWVFGDTQKPHAPPKYTTGTALAHAHRTTPLLWRREKRCHASVPNQLIVEALDCRPLSKGLAALAGSRGLGFEFWDQLQQRPDAGGDMAVAFLEGALASASQLQGAFLPLGAQNVQFCAAMLHREPRWKPALNHFSKDDEATIRSWATSRNHLITRLSRASAMRKARLFLALVSLAEQQAEPDAVRILCLQALDGVYEYVPEPLIQAAPIGLLRQAYPTVKNKRTAELVLARPEVLSDRSWVVQILNALQHRKDVAGNLPTLAMRAFSGQQALTEARQIFEEFVQPSRHALLSFTIALVYEEPKLRKMLTPAIVVACLSAGPDVHARNWLLKELARLGQQRSRPPQMQKSLHLPLKSSALKPTP